jgi:hypothetical protein
MESEKSKLTNPEASTTGEQKKENPMLRMLKRQITVNFDKTREALLNADKAPIDDGEKIHLDHSHGAKKLKSCKHKITCCSKKTGYLENLNHKLFSSYTRRHVVLEGEQLYLYNEKQDGTMKFKKCFNFDLYSITMELGFKDGRPGFTLRVKNCPTEFFYRSTHTEDTPEARKDLQEWITAISKHV